MTTLLEVMYSLTLKTIASVAPGSFLKISCTSSWVWEVRLVVDVWNEVEDVRDVDARASSSRAKRLWLLGAAAAAEFTLLILADVDGNGS
jgi:hypothetical protein